MCSDAVDTISRIVSEVSVTLDERAAQNCSPARRKSHNRMKFLLQAKLTAKMLSSSAPRHHHRSKGVAMMWRPGIHDITALDCGDPPALARS